jgi:cytochrome c oxidase subunit 4
MDKAHVERPYIKVFGWLGLLTAVEVGVASTDLPNAIRIVFLVALAATKALLVAMYYMHLRYDRPVLMLVAASPLLLAVLFTLALMPDIGIGP